METYHEIGVNIVGDEQFFRGYLEDVGDSTITVDGNVLMLSEIERVRIYHPFFKTIGVAQRIAGFGVIGLNGVNNALNHHSPLVSDGQWIWAAALVGTSYVWDFFSRDTYYMHRGWKLQTIDYRNIE